MPIRTSAVFYRRGVPNSVKDFGFVASGNFTIFQPTLPIINSSFFNKGINNVIYNKK